MVPADPAAVSRLTRYLTELISETNGLSLDDSLELVQNSALVEMDPGIEEIIRDFRELLGQFRLDREQIDALLAHPFSDALSAVLKAFPLPYREEHIHLTGSLDAEFIFPRLAKLLDGPDSALYERKIVEVYGPDALPIESVADVDRLIRLREGDRFERYLKVLYLSKLILTTREVHAEAAFHMASKLYRDYNVGAIRLKFTLFRGTSDSSEQIPGLDELTPEDVVMGLYDGFRSFQREFPGFEFILSPSFRKEASFYDTERFASKKEQFDDQVRQILELLEFHPELRNHMHEIDTVGDEKGFYRKAHFQEMKTGVRKLQAYGFSVRSHHGETWNALRQGINAVDNAMNIWHVDAIEHGLSLGINPNYYFHSLLQRVMKWNRRGEGVIAGSLEHNELMDMDWNERDYLRDRIVAGETLSEKEITLFTKAKFHAAKEVETYQHDVLNRMIDKRLSLIALPSSNKRLTGAFEDFKDHPFSWWEKKGLKLGVGTDNYITLNTNYIREMLILLYTDPLELKITKLLIVTTGETRRPYISHLLWEMRKKMTGVGR
jgi:adenosine deaminase